VVHGYGLGKVEVGHDVVVEEVGDVRGPVEDEVVGAVCEFYLLLVSKEDFRGVEANSHFGCLVDKGNTVGSGMKT
jgi:hypothetical protein